MYGELATRLQDDARKWLEEFKTVDDVLEKIIVEEFLTTLMADLRIWIAEKKLTTSMVAEKLADDYSQARRQAQLHPNDLRSREGVSQMHASATSAVARGTSSETAL